jgi:hypothetical protein
MWISSYTPRLTVAEADRCWMSPAAVCGLAAVGDSVRPETRKFLNNVSDRGLIPYIKSGEGKTAPKLYSLVSAVMLRTIKEITANGRPYDFAGPIARQAGEIARNLIEHHGSLDEIDYGGPEWVVLYESDHGGRVARVRTARWSTLQAGDMLGTYDLGIFSAGEVVWNVIRHYADPWARERIILGLDAPAGRYDGSDDQGRPLDPAHPWNASLPPLERARRLVEIEEYITAREDRDHASPSEPSKRAD